MQQYQPNATIDNAFSPVDVSTSPTGEVFPLPRPEDYNQEFKRLKKLVNEQRLKGREIVAAKPKGVSVKAFLTIRSKRE